MKNKCAKFAEVYVIIQSAIDLLERAISAQIGDNELIAIESKLNELEIIFADLEKDFLILGVMPAEYERIKNKLSLDYQENVDAMKFYELGGIGPSFDYVMKCLTAQDIKLYREMEEQELMPRLQMTPLLKSMQEMSEHFNQQKEKLNIITSKKGGTSTYLGNVNERNYIYDAEDLKVSLDGTKLVIKAGRSHAEFQQDNRGVLMEIVATKPKFPIALSMLNQVSVVKTKGELAVAIFKDLRQNGYYGLTGHSYMFMQMMAMRRGESLDKEIACFLLNSLPDDGLDLLSGSRHHSAPMLMTRPAVKTLLKEYEGQVETSVVRMSIRIKHLHF